MRTSGDRGAAPDPDWFLAVIVNPTVEEFRKAPGSIRRGMLAALAVSHLADYVVAKALGESSTRTAFDKKLKALTTENCDLSRVRDIADVSKHARLIPPRTVDNVSAIRHAIEPLEDREGRRTLDRSGEQIDLYGEVAVEFDDRSYRLREPLEKALEFLKERMSE